MTKITGPFLEAPEEFSLESTLSTPQPLSEDPFLPFYQADSMQATFEKELLPELSEKLLPEQFENFLVPDKASATLLPYEIAYTSSLSDTFVAMDDDELQSEPLTSLEIANESSTEEGAFLHIKNKQKIGYKTLFKGTNATAWHVGPDVENFYFLSLLTLPSLNWNDMCEAATYFCKKLKKHRPNGVEVAQRGAAITVTGNLVELAKACGVNSFSFPTEENEKEWKKAITVKGQFKPNGSYGKDLFEKENITRWVLSSEKQGSYVYSANSTNLANSICNNFNRSKVPQLKAVYSGTKVIVTGDIQKLAEACGVTSFNVPTHNDAATAKELPSSVASTMEADAKKKQKYPPGYLFEGDNATAWYVGSGTENFYFLSLVTLPSLKEHNLYKRAIAFREQLQKYCPEGVTIAQKGVALVVTGNLVDLAKACEVDSFNLPTKENEEEWQNAIAVKEQFRPNGAHGKKIFEGGNVKRWFLHPVEKNSYVYFSNNWQIANNICKNLKKCSVPQLEIKQQGSIVNVIGDLVKLAKECEVFSFKLPTETVNEEQWRQAIAATIPFKPNGAHGKKLFEGDNIHHWFLNPEKKESYVYPTKSATLANSICTNLNKSNVPQLEVRFSSTNVIVTGDIQKLAEACGVDSFNLPTTIYDAATVKTFTPSMYEKQEVTPKKSKKSKSDNIENASQIPASFTTTLGSMVNAPKKTAITLGKRPKREKAERSSHLSV
jgi:ribosomal protein L6P/L9E